MGNLCGTDMNSQTFCCNKEQNVDSPSPGELKEVRPASRVLAKKITKVEAKSAGIGNVMGTQKSSENSATNVIGGIFKGNIGRFSRQLFSSLSNTQISSKVLESMKSKSTLIIDKLNQFRSHLPHDLQDDLDWCIKEIKGGHIYDAATSDLRDQLGEADEHYAHVFDIYSEAKEKAEQQTDEQASLAALLIRRKATNELKSILRNETIQKVQCDSLDMDIFKLKEEFGNVKSLEVIANLSMKDFKLLQELNIDQETFTKWVRQLGQGYKESNPYHNVLHAADVLQMSYVYMKNTTVIARAQLDTIHIFSFFLSAIVHDIGHPGRTNAYLMNIMDDVAVIYNDKSVLENFHIASAFKIMRRPGTDIFAKMSAEEFRTVRRFMIECVLATDMSKHGKQLTTATNKMDNMADEKVFTLSFLLHAADIGHATRPWSITEKWTELITEEFFQQGDEEKKKGLEVFFLGNRETVNVPKSQVGFITCLVMPLYMILAEKIPEMDPMIKNINENIGKWEELAKQAE